MKKITTAFFFMCALWGYSQVKSYTFSQSTGSYSPISGGTVLGDTSSDNQYFVDETVLQGSTIGTGPGLPIGFDFTFNGQVYDRFGVNNDGWISFGTSSLTPAVNMQTTSSGYTPLSTAVEGFFTRDPVYTARIAALAANIQAQTNAILSYQTIGTAGNKVLVIQWEKYKKNGTNGDGDLFSFQIRLNQNSNTVQVAYGNFTSNDTANALFQVGLRAENTVGTNFLNRVSSTGWDNTTAGVAVTDRVLMTSTLKPSMGLTYTWTPPACGAAKALVASPTIDSAMLSWSSFTPAPAGYEYVLSTSTALPTGSGTSAGANASVTISNGLTPNTLYNFFIRSKCGSDFTPWILLGSFKTKCLDNTVIYEDFEKYDTTIPGLLPDCWDRTGSTGTMALYSDLNIKGLQLAGNASPSINVVGYAVLPPVSNLQAGTHRLKFKAFTSSNTGDPRTLDVGYLTDPNDVGTYQHITTVDLPYSIAAIKQFIVVPGVLTKGGKNLVFREKGLIDLATTAFVDDIVWEPNPACPDVTKLVAKGITQNSAKISWTSGGTEAAWQYVYALPSVTDPNTLTPVDVPGLNALATINGLSAATVYKVWVRSKCDHSLGAWIGPLSFATLCPAATEIHENFDAASTFPACWRKFETGQGTVSISAPSSPVAPSLPNALNLNGGSLANYAMIALPPLSNTGAATHRMRIKVRTTAAGGKLDIGWLTDSTDPNTFNWVQSVTPTGITTYEYFVVNLGSAPQSPYLAFKNSGVPASAVLVDDVIWEPKPSCADVSALKVNMVKSTSVDFSWAPANSETKWQYVVGPASVIDPTTLTPVDVSGGPIATASNLNTSTSYKIWIRSKCSDTSLGAWIGPLVLSTYCSPVTSFKENFDSAAALPVCWTKVGTFGTVAVGSSVTPVSTPNSLSMLSPSNYQQSIVSIQPVSNAADGTYELKFRFRGSVVGAKLEIGYLTNPADPTSFVSLNKTYTASSTTLFDTVTADLGTDPGSEVLAFRNYGIPLNATIYIDDVRWQPLGTIDPPVNDESEGAITLKVGTDFGLNSVIESNVGATNSVQPTPGCGGFKGKDVWNKAIVPATGNITFEVNTMAGGLINTAAAAYSGPSSALTLISCNDSGSTAGDDHPKISLSGRTPGEVIYFRVWENGGDAFGSFLASAYDTTATVLGSDTFETNNFAFYPNPVKDILNLSLNQEITNVTVFNLLGQQVINQSANENHIKIDMSGLSKGAYLVKVISGNQSKTIKVVKE